MLSWESFISLKRIDIRIVRIRHFTFIHFDFSIQPYCAKDQGKCNVFGCNCKEPCISQYKCPLLGYPSARSKINMIRLKRWMSIVNYDLPFITNNILNYDRWTERRNWWKPSWCHGKADSWAGSWYVNISIRRFVLH